MNESQRSRNADDSTPSVSDWRRQLEILVSSGTSAADAVSPGTAEAEHESYTALALQFERRELIPRTAERWNGPTSRAVKPGQEEGSGIYRLGVRPAMRTAKGWARGNLTWANIGHQGSRLNLDPAQQRWFRQIVALYRAATTITVGLDSNWVFLDDFESPGLWAILQQAEGLGIALVAAGTHQPVRLHQRASLSLDVLQDAGSELRVDPRLEFDGVGLSLRGGGTIGDHGLYAAPGETRSEIQLAPVAGTLSAAERALLGAAQVTAPVVVPASERAAFLSEGLPELRASFRVASSNQSVLLPAPKPAVARLTAAWRRGHRLTLTWSCDAVPGVPLPVVSQLLLSELVTNEFVPAEWAEADEELPEPCELRGADAAEFLHRAVPQLEKITGIEVRVTGAAPAYREQQGEPTLTVTAVPSETEDWFDLGVLVTVAGKTVPFAPLFRALAKGSKKLLLIDNSYLHLNHPAFALLAELIAEGQDLDEWDAGLRLTRHQAVAIAGRDDLEDPAESESARAWHTLLQELGQERPDPVEVPAGILAQLRPYQLTGFYWLAFLWRNRLGGILADDMGLGKTLQCLTLIEWAKHQPRFHRRGGAAGARQRPFLIVAPTSVMSNWAAEAARFAPGLRVIVRTATAATSGRSVAEDAHEIDVLVTSYALFRLDYEQYYEVAIDPDRGFAGLILDEAQFVKNAQAQGNELAEQLPVAWKLAMTGTPMENSLRELHAITRIVAPGLFPSARRFDKDYVRAIERPAPGVSVGRGAGGGPAALAGLRAQRLQQLRRKLRPFMLRRTKALVAQDLPEKQEQVLEIELEAGHRQLYDAFLQRERQKLYGLITDLDRNRFTVFRSLTLLRMLALDASLIDEQYAAIPSAKLDALVEHTQALAKEGRRALVFSQFTSFLDRGRQRLEAAGVRTVTLDGTTRNRDAVIDSFRGGEADVFLISLKAGGIGLNLTEADTVFLLDPWWNPASEAQAIDRSHRIGQRQPVHVLRMIALGTIEEKVLKLQQRKRALFDQVVDDDALFSRELTAADVRELLE